MAETFGEADIVLRLRLDELEAGIARSEQMVTESTSRVESERVQSLQTIARAERGVSDRVLPDMKERIALMGILTSKTSLLARAVAAVGTSAAAAAAVSATALFAMIAAAGVASGLMFEARDRTIKFAREMVDSYRAMDGSKERAREFAAELERIPVLGSAISTTFRIFSKDAQQSEESLAGIATVVEDGQVKTRAWASLGSLLVKGLTLGFVDLRKGINEANEAMSRLQFQNNVRAGGQEFESDLFQQTDAIERNAAREAELSRLEGVERVRAAERHRMEDLVRGYELARRAAQGNHIERLRQLQEQRDAGDISEKQFNTASAIIAADANRQIDNLMKSQAASQADLAASSEARVAAATEELRLAEETAAAEARRSQARRDADNAQLEALTRATELRSIGEDLEAQRVEIEHRTQQAIADAMADGNDIAADLERRRGDALLQIVENAAAERAAAEQRAEESRRLAMEQAQDREIESARRAREQMYDESARQLDTRERLRSQILQERLRQQGRDIEAERERIESDAYLDIMRLRDAGNDGAAELRATLRDLQLAGLDMQQGPARTREFQQVSASRFSAGGVGDDRAEKQRDEQVKALRGIERNTREANVAVAG